MKIRELSMEERNKIISLHQKSLGYKKIHKKTKIGVSTVAYIIKKWKATGSVVNRSRRGPRRKTTRRVDRHILRRVLPNRGLSAPKITAEVEDLFGVSVSPQTIRNRLHEEGYNGRVARKKPFISKRNMKRRLDWARTHSSWTVDDWKRVLWTDESKFMLFGSDGIVRVWRKPGEQMNPLCLRKTVKHGGGCIMVWGSMAWNGVGNLDFIETTMTKEVYIENLKKNLQPSVRKLRLRGRVIFQQDNDPKHTAKIVKKWFEDNKVNVLPWVPQSPDLNPIEHLWSELERRITKRNPKNKEELKDILKDAWDNIDPEVTKKLVESMPRRVQAVIESKGGPTRY